MPDLFDSLLKQDIGHLRVIAELWGIELDSTDIDDVREELTVSLLEPELLAELIDTLSPEAEAAITALVNSGGRIPWPTFTRKYGEIREAGAGKRDREKLYLKPTSATEVLYYRGLLARAFQHEMDHLEGVVFVDRLRGIKREMIVRKIQKMKRAGKW